MRAVDLPSVRQITAVHLETTACRSLIAAGLPLRPSTSNCRLIIRRTVESSLACRFTTGGISCFPSLSGEIWSGSGVGGCHRNIIWNSVFSLRNAGGCRNRWLGVPNNNGRGGNGGIGGSGSGSGPGGSGDGGGDESGGRTPSFLSWYSRHLEESPVLTKALTSALLTFIGDSICQLLVEQVPKWDLKRTFLFSFLGMVLVGPTLHFWYLALSKMVSLPGGSGAFLRLLLDQFIFSPLFIGVFLSTLVTVEGRPSEVLPKLHQEWFSAVVANWQLWIPFQFLNFLYVPQKFQVLFANVVAVAWNVILSFKAHKIVTSQ